VSRSFFLALVVAVVTAAVWPWFVAYRTLQARADDLPAVAPVTADYRYRDKLVAFWEGAVRSRARNDMLSPRNLADQYLQRYRETGDIADVLRAVHMAQRSLDVMPSGNAGADLSMSSALLTLHRFREARRYVLLARIDHPRDATLVAREASLDMELGDYAAARALLASAPVKDQLVNSEWQTVQARYDELTGHLERARAEISKPAMELDSNFSAPAQSRAWYHLREGEMAFDAGDRSEALLQERSALALFPRYADALRDLARFECAARDWRSCLGDATRSADLVPFPEALGYKVDAERGLGDEAAAARTGALIETVERVGNAQHISDRLLAVYYSEHGIHVADALRIARNELAVRDDIYTEDTLAWAAAMAGRWDEARRASAKAIRFDTEDSRLQYHAGIIALHFGDRAFARKRLQRALALNPAFHAFYADDARAQLARI
jgi:tetratricopeptide (TPR) repeat protein